MGLLTPFSVPGEGCCSLQVVSLGGMVRDEIDSCIKLKSKGNRAFHELNWKRGFGCTHTQQSTRMFEFEVMVVAFCLVVFMRRSIPIRVNIQRIKTSKLGGGGGRRGGGGRGLGHSC